MNPPRNVAAPRSCVLIDFLDSSGDHLEDARERQRALALAGLQPVALAVMSDADLRGSGSEGPARGPVPVGTRDWPHALREAASRAPGATLLGCGLDDDARWEEVSRRWSGPAERWPTRLCGESAADGSALEWAVAARGSGARTSLWDGAYLLVPSALRGPDGERLLEVFAEVAEEHDMLDLVVLGDLSAELQCHARALGVGLRVHGVGPAPLRAECTWLAGAAAVVAGAGSLPGLATTLRALAGPAPLLAAGEGRAACAMRAWLASHGATMSPLAEEPGALGRALRLALAGAPEARAAVARGAELSASFTVGSAAEALRRRRAGAADPRAAA